MLQPSSAIVRIQDTKFIFKCVAGGDMSDIV